ncbi:MAG: hypothetical protein U0892_13230 [Pirellulales bacterium]
MNRMTFTIRLMIAWMAILSVPTMATAQGQRAQATKRNSAVDVVTLKSGRQLRGMITHVAGDGRVRMAIERQWLKKSAEDFYDKTAAAERKETKEALEQLLKRIEDAATLHAQDQIFSGFLATQKDRVTSLLAGLESETPVNGRFVWVVIPQKELKSTLRATLSDRRIAVWAWREQLDRVELRPADDLASELKKRNVDVSQPLPDLSIELAAIQETDRQWAARLAIAKSFNSVPLEFQGSGDVFAVSNGKDQPAIDPAALVQQMMGGNMADLIKELTEPTSGSSKRTASSDAWLSKLITQAEEREATSFRVTRLIPDPSAMEATVEGLFVVRMPDKSWAVVWRTRCVTQTTEVKDAAVQRITDDPQVKSVRSVIQSLGGAAETEVRKALRFGAATESSLSKVGGEFSAFVGRYSGALESPPMEFE